MRRARVCIPILIAVLALLVPAMAGAVIERTVSVSASATLKVPNDSAGVGLSVSKERRSRGAALRAVSAKLRGVIAAVQGVPGVGEGDVTTGRISVRKTFRGTKPVYRASEGIAVTLHQPDKAGELVSAAIAAGATGVRGPTYFVGDTERAFAEALGAAFDKAKGRATALATRAGATLGPALTIDEGEGPQLTPQFDAKAVSAPASGCATASPAPSDTATSPPVSTKRVSACAAPPPTKPGTSTVTATVRVIFALQ
ncbi:MAG TPA: SIMPL domain-containing protein [Solirubrobacterales bacterium]|nr:SIMPL domain-containing protein [Solirubrobacterales bacterium]